MKKSRRVLKRCLIILLITAWVFSGWPQIMDFPWQIHHASAAPDIYYLRDAADEDVCGLGADEDDLSTTQGASNVDKALTTTGHSWWHQFSTESVREAGNYVVTLRGDHNNSGGNRTITIVLRRMNSSCVEQQVLITSFACTPGKGEADWTCTSTTAQSSVTFAANDYLLLEVDPTSSSHHTLQYNGSAAPYDSSVDIPAEAAAAEPTFTLNDYRWYVDSDSENVTDPWGVPDIAENTALTPLPAGNDPPGPTQELRLRVNFTVNTANLSTTDQQFTLKYKAGTDADCTTGSWTDVDAGAGAGIWRFASSSVTDGADLTALKLAASDVLEEYVKSNPSPVNHNTATTGQDIEYDFHIEHNGAADATQYSFRVVESDGTIFDAYNTCPTLITEPGTSNLLRHGLFFADQLKQGFFWAN